MFNEGLNLTDLSLYTIKRIEKLTNGTHECDNKTDMFGVKFHHKFEFANGFGISIAKNYGTYGKERDLWEIAVMDGDELCYDSPVASDVVGWLSQEEVVNYAKEISEINRKQVEEYRRIKETKSLVAEMHDLCHKLEEEYLPTLKLPYNT